MKFTLSNTSVNSQKVNVQGFIEKHFTLHIVIVPFIDKQIIMYD